MKKLLLFLLLFLPLLSLSTQTKKTTITMIHKGYTTIYDTTLDYPVMVHWLDLKSRVGCDNPIPRKDCFAPDPMLPKQTNLQSAYDMVNKTHKNTNVPGVDRGHMCPAADNQCDNTELVECFYFSNMAPQYHSLNAGDWKKIEVMTRELSIQYDSVYVWCGSIGSSEKINGMSIPKQCWKVLYVVKTKTWYAWIMDNTPTKPQGTDKWKTTPANITKLTGFTFKL
jgi:DNA/RNA endonuclease G (NUC1)